MERFLVLDGLRGLAALAVLLLHALEPFDLEHWVPSAYLAVDFFFLLSGYVIAGSYEHKLKAGLSFAQFLKLRLARLWPLVAASTLFGLIVQLPRWQRMGLDVDPATIGLTLLCNALMLPSPASPNQFLFPVNGAAWSIFFEMVANLAYAIFLPVLGGRALAAIISAGAAGLIYAALSTGSLDVGWSTSNFVFGFPRVACSFFLGILMFRWIAARDDVVRTPATLLLALLATGVILSIPKLGSGSLDALVDMVTVLIIAPAVMYLAATTRLGRIGNNAAWFLGGCSFSLYLLQTPLLIAYSAVPQLLVGRKIAEFAPWGGLIFIALALPISFMSWRIFEIPMQNWLRSIRVGRTAPASMVAGGTIDK